MVAHESMPENLVESLLGGREIRDEQFLSLMELLTGEAPRPLWVHDRAIRWSVVFSPERPLRLVFQNNRVQFALAVSETVRAKERLAVPAVASATFVVIPTPDGPVFQRQGDLTVELGEHRLSTAQADELSRFLAHKFGALLPAELQFDGLAAPAGGFGDRIRQLQTYQVRFREGWAMVSYKLQPSAKSAGKILVSAPAQATP
jgi:hypothetical protein